MIWAEASHLCRQRFTAQRASTAALRLLLFFFSSRRRHTRFDCDWSSDVCSSDLDPPPQVQRGSRRGRLPPDLPFGLALPEGLRERRPVVGRMRLGADQADRARGGGLVEGLRRGVGGHATADNEVGVVGHRAWALLYAQYTLPLERLDRGCARCRFLTCQAPISRARSPSSRCSTSRSGGVFISTSPSGDAR